MTRALVEWGMRGSERDTNVFCFCSSHVVLWENCYIFFWCESTPPVAANLTWISSLNTHLLMTVRNYRVHASAAGPWSSRQVEESGGLVAASRGHQLRRPTDQLVYPIRWKQLCVRSCGVNQWTVFDPHYSRIAAQQTEIANTRADGDASTQPS